MRFDPNQVIVEVPEKGYYDSTPNLVIYDREKQAPLGIGEDRQAFLSEMREKNVHLPENIGLAPAFGTEPLGEKLDGMVIEYYLARYLMKKARFTFLPVPYGWIDYDLVITDYDQWTEPRQRAFQNLLQLQYHARMLRINGQEVCVPFWKRWVSSILFLLVNLVFLVLLIFGILAALPSIWTVLWVTAGSLVFGFLSYIGWMAFTRRASLPDDFVKYQLKRYPANFLLQAAARLMGYR